MWPFFPGTLAYMLSYVLPCPLTQKYICLGQVKADITYFYLSALMASALTELGISNTLATDFKNGFHVDNNICYHIPLSLLSFLMQIMLLYTLAGICRIMLRKVKIADIFVLFLPSMKNTSNVQCL